MIKYSISLSFKSIGNSDQNPRWRKLSCENGKNDCNENPKWKWYVNIKMKIILANE